MKNHKRIPNTLAVFLAGTVVGAALVAIVAAIKPAPTDHSELEKAAVAFFISEKSKNEAADEYLRARAKEAAAMAEAATRTNGLWEGPLPPISPKALEKKQ